jgi:hypothetical protein
MGITPAWALSTFGFIAIAMIPIPFVLYVSGERWRGASKYAGEDVVVVGREVAVTGMPKAKFGNESSSSK